MKKGWLQIKVKEGFTVTKEIDRKELLRKISGRYVSSWIDKLTFLHIFLIWVSAVILFGVIYFYFQTQFSYLFYIPKGAYVDRLKDGIYFSFVTATTTGFGDVVPFGFFKLISVIEVIFGLLLLAVVTSKLVSIRQDVILNELYEISFNERVNKLRSSLLLFRQNLERVIVKVEEKDFKKREVGDLHVYLSALEDTLGEALSVITKSNKKIFIKNIDPISVELIINSILSSFEKLSELINIMDQSKIEWRGELTNTLVKGCISLNEGLFNNLKSSEILVKESLKNLDSRKSKVIANINGALSKQ